MVKKIKQTQDSSKNSELPCIPVVTVLGHVDHGKTSLLDAIRKTSVVQGEHGGITQKIGASSIELVCEGITRTITFIDTPGHAAFSQMRSRGATAADIGLLVVASNDGVMPQTKESIQHLKESQIPFIVVITKSDLPDKNPEKVKKQLEKEGLVLEGRGGDIPVIEVSAQAKTNITELLELILLVFDMKQTVPYLELVTKPFEAIVIESKLDAKSGPLATIVVKKGTLSIRDELVCEGLQGRVRTLTNDHKEQLSSVTVGQAVEILGFQKVPAVGGIVYKKLEFEKEQEAEKKAEVIQEEYDPTAKKHELSIILCADTKGSLEAIVNSLPKAAHLVMQKTGDVSEADVLHAKSTGAIILGFNIRIRNEVAHLAAVEKILVKNYTIIYELLDEVQDVLEGKRLALEEKIFGVAKILAIFPFEKTQVLGVRVMEGRVARGDKIRIMRGDTVVGESLIVSLRQGREQTSKVEQNKEAGILISPFLDFTIGDMILCHS